MRGCDRSSTRWSRNHEFNQRVLIELGRAATCDSYKRAQRRSNSKRGSAYVLRGGSAHSLEFPPRLTRENFVDAAPRRAAETLFNNAIRTCRVSSVSSVGLVPYSPSCIFFFFFFFYYQLLFKHSSNRIAWNFSIAFDNFTVALPELQHRVFWRRNHSKFIVLHLTCYALSVDESYEIFSAPCPTFYITVTVTVPQSSAHSSLRMGLLDRGNLCFEDRWVVSCITYSSIVTHCRGVERKPPFLKIVEVPWNKGGERI